MVSLRTGTLIALVSPILIMPPMEAKAEDGGNALPSNFTGHVGLVTDYVFRGITQSNEVPALQAGVDYTYDLDETTAFYLGFWGTNVNFNDGDEATLETDWYGGFRKKIDNWSFDLGAIYYLYPGADNDLNYNFLELQAKAGYDFGVASATASVNYSSDYFAGSGNALYTKLSAAVPLPHDFVLNGYVGHQTIDDNAAFAVPDYTDYGAGVSYTYKGDWSLSLNYIGTDLSHSECTDGCGERVVFGITKTF